MDSRAIFATKPFIKRYADQAIQSFESRRNQILTILTTMRVPDIGWPEGDIECLMHELSLMDSNNFPGNCGVGEREARFASDIVARRHFRMGHGIGRSGDITEIQPKAAGSSLIATLANEFILDILKTVGSPSTRKCLVVPLATGMGLVLCMRTLHSKRPSAKYVVWSRIDQKSCFKCILTAGLEPLIINCKEEDNKLVTDTDAMSSEIKRVGPENVVCILTTTSCFAPRCPDNLSAVGHLCVCYNIPHLVNNAYGIQCPQFLQMIEKASKTRVDVYVSSTDKNFMVPVGGSIIAGFDDDIIDDISKMYPGRASAAPSVDVFITLLNIGKKGYEKLLLERAEMYFYLKRELIGIAEKFSEIVVDPRENSVSIAISLKTFQENDNLLTEIGSMLFSKFVSGSRVIALGDNKNIGDYTFCNWGSHTDTYKFGYLTAASTIGITQRDVDVFIEKLNKVLKRVRRNSLLMY